MKIIPCLMFVFAVAAWLGVSTQAGPPSSAFGGVLDATYMIENQEVHLIGGRAEVQAAPGSATKISTVVFGKPVYGDLDGDGDQDAVLILVHDPGGSGTFYYVAAALNLNGGYRGTNAVLLGDRVTPRDLQIRNGVVMATYATRRSGEPMSTAPSVDRCIYLTLENGKLKALNLLGESDFNRPLGWEAEVGSGGSRSDSFTSVTFLF